MDLIFILILLCNIFFEDYSKIKCYISIIQIQLLMNSGSLDLILKALGLIDSNTMEVITISITSLLNIMISK